jgi:YafQ family addiction module toxin component
MNYSADYTKKLEKTLFKLRKRDIEQLKTINKKLPQILSNPYRFKPLRNKMTGVRRVHIMKSFVLTFEIIKKDHVVRFLDYNHHDNIYG